MLKWQQFLKSTVQRHQSIFTKFGILLILDLYLNNITVGKRAGNT